MRSLHDRDELEALLRRDVGLHVYALGDLDDFFWDHTTWYGQGDDVLLLYGATRPPTLVGLGRDLDRLAALLHAAAPLLPARTYAHLSDDLAARLGAPFVARDRSPHLKMLLTDPAALDRAGAGATVRLGPADRAEVEAFYAAAYPGNWFAPRMLETGVYVGARVDGALAAVAGVHVLSRRYRVAALGNIATAPACRGRGLGRAVTTALCRDLRGQVDHVGLNVEAGNPAAIALYRRLGFEVVAGYEECALELNPAA